MNQICLTCKSIKNIRNTTYKTKKANWKLKSGIKSIFPNDIIPDLNNIKESRIKNYDMKHSLNLNKSDSGKYVLYYAADLRIKCLEIPNAKDSYNTFKNMGISRLDSDGQTTLYLRCPNVYKENNRTFHPHVHFILSNKDCTKWNDKLYTKIIVCDINKKYVQNVVNNKCAIILNALPMKYYIKNRIPNSFSLPTEILNDLTDKEIINYISNMLIYYPKIDKKVKNKQLNIMDIPIITYCYSKKCNASEKLCNRLLKIGFINIKEYSNGILDWY